MPALLFCTSIVLMGANHSSADIQSLACLASPSLTMRMNVTNPANYITIEEHGGITKRKTEVGLS